MDTKEVVFLSFIILFFDKKTASLVDKSTPCSGIKLMPNQQLADEPHTPIIRSVYSLFRDNICGVDLADMQLISKCNKEIRFLLCVFDIFTKYAWLIPLKVKEGVAIVNAFQRMSDDLKRKSYKIWVDKGSEFYN